MYITYITLVLHLLHALQSILICITHYKCNVWAGNLLNLHEDYRGRPSTWYVCCFLPSLGAESRWDDRGGNSKSVRNTELMMECNDCLFEGWNEQTATTHIETRAAASSPPAVWQTSELSFRRLARLMTHSGRRWQRTAPAGGMISFALGWCHAGSGPAPSRERSCTG